MEQNKYYTPLVEELFLGYECEKYEPANTGTDYLGHYYESWDRITMRTRWNLLDVMSGNHVIRTKYLDKEDIESLGWISLGEYNFDNPGFIANYDVYEKKHITSNKLCDGLDYCWHLLLPAFSKFGHYGQFEIIIEKTTTGGFAGGTKETKIFEGFCKSINELRIIQKLLGISQTTDL